MMEVLIENLFTNLRRNGKRGITRDLRLQRLLETIPYPKGIITNASYTHAFLSLKHLDISHLFMSMVDANDISIETRSGTLYFSGIKVGKIYLRHSNPNPHVEYFMTIW